MTTRLDEAALTALDRVVAGRQLPVGRPDLPARQPAAARAAAAGARQAAAARPLGHDAGPEPPLRPPQPGRSAERDLDMHLRHRARATAARRWSPTPGWRAPTARSTRRQPRRGGHAPAVPAVLVPRRHPEPRRAGDARLDPRGRRAGLLAGARLRRRVRQPGPGRRLRRRRRRGRDRPAGRELALATSSSTRRATARCCRSSTSTATRSPTRRSWPASPDDELRALLEGYGYEPYLVDGDDPAGVHQPLAADARRRASTRSPRSRQARPRRTATGTRPRWPMIVLRTPKGWTGPEEVDGLPVEGTWRSHQVPLADVRDEPGAPARCSRSGCAATGPRSCSTTTARPRPSSSRWRRPASGG